MSTNSNNTPLSEEDAVYEVEKICNHRRSKINSNLVEYLIKWKDYDAKYNTWEKETNIYSKGLILEYWKKQPYTLESFRSETKKRPANASNHNGGASPRKRSATASPALSSSSKLEQRQQLIKEIKASQLSAAPPTGYTWSDIQAIVNVFHTPPNVYFAEVEWPKQTKTTYIPTRIIKKYNPLKLIKYYESKLEFSFP